MVNRRNMLAAAVALPVAAGLVGASAFLATRDGGAEPADRPAAATPASTAALTAPDPRGVPRLAWLLPNLRSLPAEELSIQVVDGQRELRFGGVIANVGVGPIVLVPDLDRPCPAGQRHASQLVYHDTDDDGRFDRERDASSSTLPAGCMLFHPEHDHWHFDSSARYALTAPGETTPVVAQDKVSFCLRDNRTVAGAADPSPFYYGECERDTVQGISPGWADVYDATLRSQRLELPSGMPDGLYCLHTSADPFGLLLESNEDDNASVVAIRITGADLVVEAADPCR